MEIEVRISKEILRDLFKNLCKHKKEYKDDYKDGTPVDSVFYWQDCEDCPLRNMKCDVKHANGLIERDLCFVIWHDWEIQFLEKALVRIILIKE